MKWTTFIFALFVVPVAWAQPDFPVLWLGSNALSVGIPGNSYANIKSVVQIPFEIKGGLIVVNGAIDGAPGRFVFDTGSPSYLINQPEAGGIEAELLMGLGQSRAATRIQVKELAWAMRRAASLNAFALDLAHIERLTREKLLGIIGAEGLGDYEILFHFEKQVLVARPGGGDYPDHILKEKIPFNMMGHLPVISLQVNGKKLRFGIDSGASVNVMDKLTAKRMKSRLTELPREAIINDINNKTERVKCVAASEITCQHGDFAPSDFYLLDLDALKEAYDYPIDGLLGIPFLRQNGISIDFKEQVLYFNK